VSEDDYLNPRCPKCGDRYPLTTGYYLKRRTLAGSTKRSDYGWTCKKCTKENSKVWNKAQHWTKTPVRPERRAAQQEALRETLALLDTIGGGFCVLRVLSPASTATDETCPCARCSARRARQSLVLSFWGVKSRRPAPAPWQRVADGPR